MGLFSDRNFFYQTHGDDELMIDGRKSCDHKNRDFRGKNGNKKRKHKVEWLPGWVSPGGRRTWDWDDRTGRT